MFSLSFSNKQHIVCLFIISPRLYRSHIINKEIPVNELLLRKRHQITSNARYNKAFELQPV